MFRLPTDVIRALDGKEHVYAFFLDLSMAFDVVHHQMLFEKLEYIEMRSRVLEWICYYVVDHKQFLEIPFIDCNVCLVKLW